MEFNSVFSIIFRSFLYLGLFILIILVLPGIPPFIKFESYRIPAPLKLEGKLAPNSLLDKAVPLFVDEFAGPESIARRGDELFTGVLGGKVLRIKDGKFSTLVQFGKECEGYWDEEICGRPLALRFNPSNNKLVVIDGYYGVFEVDPDTGNYETLFKVGQMIGQHPLTFPDDLDISRSGVIYFSDVSTYAGIDQMGIEFLGEPSGRLIRFDRKKNEFTVLMDRIHFGNGIQLSPDEEFVLISETGRLRVWRYYLSGPKKGQKEIFVDRLPGMPDNIRPNGKGGYFIALASPRDKTPSIGESLGPLPYLRKVILRVHQLILIGLGGINTILPSQTIKQSIHYIKNFGPLLDAEHMPKKVIIIEVDGNGNILRSLQNEKADMNFITEVCIGEKYTYLGSARSNKLWRLDNKDIKL